MTSPRGLVTVVADEPLRRHNPRGATLSRAPVLASCFIADRIFLPASVRLAPATLVFLLVSLVFAAVINRAWKRHAHHISLDRRALYATGAFLLVVIGLAPLLGENVFGVMRLWAWGLFVNMPVALCAVAARASLEGAITSRRDAPRENPAARPGPQSPAAPPTRLAGVLVGAAVVLVALGVFAFRIEPNRLEIVRHELVLPGLDQSVRIVVLADLQTDHVGGFEHEVLLRAAGLRPDLVLFPGDYLQIDQPERLEHEAEALRRALDDAKLEAPLGMFAVRGNVDGHGWQKIFRGTKVQAIEETQTLDLGTLQLTALSLADSFDKRTGWADGASHRATGALAGASRRPHIAFGHAPDFALDLESVDLSVAGHTHGGQVRLPFVGPLITFSAVPDTWAAGHTTILRANGRAPRHLVVSRGIGMERGHAPRLRFLCRPELTVIDLQPETRAASAASTGWIPPGR